MAVKQIVPQLALASFSCPHCGAIAQQSWFQGYLKGYERNETPEVVVYEANKHLMLKSKPKSDPEADAERDRLVAFYNRLKTRVLTYRHIRYSVSSSAVMVNLAFSLCYSCDGFGIWMGDKLIYPETEIAFVAHEEMSPSIRADFEEAASIVAKSPRGAAALLRLCIQKLAVELGEKGHNINGDIRSLVEKGKISPAIQRALDVVRVVGNNAVHPGSIDFDDNQTVATNLFGLVNLIVEAAIATPKHIKSMYETVVPEGVREAIERQDEAKRDEQ